MDNERILISGSPVEIAEYGDYKLATFMISVLDEYDLNGRMIPKESGELYHSTMIGFPILAKMVCNEAGDPVDFAGHEMYLIQDELGNTQVRFNTHPIGSVVETWIEERTVAGYLGQKSCIMIKAKLWSSRYPEYFAVLDKLWKANNVKSSWELTVQEAVQTAKGRILKAFSFIGNTLLGSGIPGAVPGAGVYEYAQLDSELELASALSKDMCQHNEAQRKEDEILENEKVEVMDEQVVAETETVEVEVDEAELAEEIVDGDPAEAIPAEEIAEQEESTGEESETESAALTDWDLRRRITDAYRAKFDKWAWVSFWFPADNEAWVEDDDRKSELDYVRVTYTVENDVVEITSAEPVKLTVSVTALNETIASRDEIIEKANQRINDLTAQIAALQPYKDAADEAERVRIEAETAEKRKAFKDKMLSSKLFTEEEIETSEALKAMIDGLDEVTLKTEIAERFMKKLEQEEPAAESVETASASVESARTVVGDSDKIDNKEFMRMYLHGN